MRSYLKGLKVIEEPHRKQLEMHTIMMEALHILSEDLVEMDFVRIIALLRGKRRCQYLSEIGSCVHLSSFEKDNKTIHANCIHQGPIMKSYSLFSCEALYYNQSFYINNLHNRVLVDKDVKRYNTTRKVLDSDYLLKDLKVAVMKVMETTTLYVSTSFV